MVGKIPRRRTWQPTLVSLPGNSMDRGAWWARVHGTIDRQTRLSTHRDKPRHYATLMAESEEELKSLLMKVKEESEKDGLKLNIQKTKIMVSVPSLNGNVMVFPVVLYGCGSWTIKKAEHWRIDAFELWCWRRLLRVSWDARRANQSILREISPKYLLEGLILKFQYFGHLMGRTVSLEKTLMLGKIEGRRRRGWQKMRWFDSITDSMDMSLSKLGSWQWTGRPDMLQSTGLQSPTWLSD